MSQHHFTREAAPFEKTLAVYQLKELFRAYEEYGNRKYESVLDVGCNNAFLTQHFTDKFHIVEGVDKNKEWIQNARDRCSDAIFHVSKIEEFEPPRKYDFVTAIDILEHLHKPVEVLRKLKDITCSDGLIHVQVPNAYSLNRRLGLKMGIIKEIHEVHHGAINMHTKEYDLEILTNHVRQAGLKTVDSGGFFLKPFTNVQMDFLLEKLPSSNDEWRTTISDELYNLGKETSWMAALIYVTAQK